jgi:drug/metabolite transporter (DMT)-like permease
VIYLLVVSFIWAFSFGLIKTHLSGLDPSFISCCRMLLSFALFLPLLRLRNLSAKNAAFLAMVGVIQYGLMYMTYISSFNFLKAYQVALFTIFTPLFVTVVNDFFQRRFTPLFLATALLAIIGTSVIVFREIHQSDFRTGFFLVQVSNLCFALGQILYRKVMQGQKRPLDSQVFALLYLGALLLTFPSAGYSTQWTIPALNSSQVLTLIYLGLLPSGICFFLWNLGARKTNAGFLAVANNLKVPLAVACSMIIFHEKGSVSRLLVGGGIIVGSLVLNELALRQWTRHANGTSAHSQGLPGTQA